VNYNKTVLYSTVEKSPANVESWQTPRFPNSLHFRFLLVHSSSDVGLWIPVGSNEFGWLLFLPATPKQRHAVMNYYSEIIHDNWRKFRVEYGGWVAELSGRSASIYVLIARGLLEISDGPAPIYKLGANKSFWLHFVSQTLLASHMKIAAPTWHRRGFQYKYLIESNINLEKRKQTKQQGPDKIITAVNLSEPSPNRLTQAFLNILSDYRGLLTGRTHSSIPRTVNPNVVHYCA
jgi:hypothetical protein